MAKPKKRATQALVEITDILETTETHVTVKLLDGREMKLSRQRVEFLPGMVQMPQWYLDGLNRRWSHQ